MILPNSSHVTLHSIMPPQSATIVYNWVYNTRTHNTYNLLTHYAFCIVFHNEPFMAAHYMEDNDIMSSAMTNIITAAAAHKYLSIAQKRTIIQPQLYHQSKVTIFSTFIMYLSFQASYFILSY